MNISEHFDALRPRVLRPAKGFLKHPYAVPGGFYDELWDWDGYFIGVHLARRGQPEYLQGWCLNFLEAASADGYVPGCLTVNGPAQGHRAFPMKPFLAQGVEECLGCGDWLEPYLQRLVSVVASRERTHYDARFGLFFWDDAMQSGADNNPAITNEPALRGQILAADINAYMIREYRALGFIARKLGYEDMVFERKAQDLCDAVEVHLWHPDDEAYWNLNRQTGAPIRVVNWTMSTLLWAEAVDIERARSMISRYILCEDHLLSPFGLRSLSSQDPVYNNKKIIWPHSNWQGPVWVVANYIAFCGLRKYGLRAQANALADRLAQVVLADLEAIGSMHENYCAETGAPLAPSADTSPDGTEGGFIGWNLLLQDMLDGTG